MNDFSLMQLTSAIFGVLLLFSGSIIMIIGFIFMFIGYATGKDLYQKKYSKLLRIGAGLILVGLLFIAIFGKIKMGHWIPVIIAILIFLKPIRKKLNLDRIRNIYFLCLLFVFHFFIERCITKAPLSISAMILGGGLGIILGGFSAVINRQKLLYGKASVLWVVVTAITFLFFVFGGPIFLFRNIIKGSIGEYMISFMTTWLILETIHIIYLERKAGRNLYPKDFGFRKTIK